VRVLVSAILASSLTQSQSSTPRRNTRISYRPVAASAAFNRPLSSSSEADAGSIHSPQAFPSAVALYVAHYNFYRVREALRVTPAMQLGIADHV
jgi:hypothetical protein